MFNSAIPLSVINWYDKLAVLSLEGLFAPIPWFAELGVGIGDNIWFALLIIILVIKELSDTGYGSFQNRIKAWYEIGRYLVGGIVLSGVVLFLKFGLQVPRPSITIPVNIFPDLGMLNSYASFPSLHSALFFYLTCIVYNEFPNIWIRIIAGVMFLWIVLARVIVGFHFPTDIIVGAILGYIAWRLVYRK